MLLKYNSFLLENVLFWIIAILDCDTRMFFYQVEINKTKNDIYLKVDALLSIRELIHYPKFHAVWFKNPVLTNVN